MDYQEEVAIYGRPVKVSASLIGPDVLITVTGGDQPHLGVVTAGTRLEPLQTVQLQTHKEFYITESWSVRIRQIFKGNFFVVSGVHFDGLTKTELQAATKELELLVEGVIKWLNNMS